MGSCVVIHFISIGLTTYQMCWAASLDKAEIKKELPSLYYSSLFLQKLVLFAVVKDIIIQIVVYCSVLQKTRLFSLSSHLLGFLTLLPFIVVMAILTIVSIKSNRMQKMHIMAFQIRHEIYAALDE